jgi:hypothetical protein
LTYVLAEPVDRPIEKSTLGFAVSAADEHDLRAAIETATATEQWQHRAEVAINAYRRDKEVAKASNRWSGDPLGPRDREYLPGDVCGLRASACQGSLQVLEEVLRDPDSQPDDISYLPRQVGLAEALYEAIPYFVPVRATFGIAGSHPPDRDLIDDIRLPFPQVALFFGADLDLPDTMVGGEAVVMEKGRWLDEQRRVGADTMLAHLAPPSTISAPLLALARGGRTRVTGVVLRAGPQGVGLDDTVLWLTVTDGKDGVMRRLDPGSLSHATVEPIVANLAAAVAWGDWKPPPLDLEIPVDAASPQFRRALRGGRFRRREASGAVAQVRVLDVQRMTRRAEAMGGTHASPATHLRRGYTRRQRVGPTDAWHYETRYILPVLVNPTGEHPSTVTVYRLPDPR